MSVYVDQLRWHPVVRGHAKKYGSEWCHLTADTLEELHAFAGAIGCRRTWFQDTKYPHYDLTPARRERAVKAGAVQITAREWVQRHDA